MLNFLLKVIIFAICFVIFFSVTQNISPAKVVERIIEAAKELWGYVRSLFDDDYMNPNL